MSIVNNYLFDNMGRIGMDSTDSTQRTLLNTRFANYMLSNYTSDRASNTHVQFATQQPNVMFSGMTHGHGLNGSIVDIDSMLTVKKESDRPLEKLSLMQRPFLTVPYLGKGSCDPTLESQLMQGEMVNEKKSTKTISEKSYSSEYSLFTSDSKMKERVTDTRYTVEESALDGWVRGGSASRMK
jgi:hypothetical protein